MKLKINKSSAITFFVVALAINVSTYAATYSIKPIDLSSNNCQVTVENTDTNEIFSPEFQVHPSLMVRGTYKLIDWRNGFPYESKVVTITPYVLSETLNVVIHVEWNITDTLQKETLHKELNLTYSSTENSSAEIYQDLEERIRKQSDLPFNNLPDPKNQYQYGKLIKEDGVFQDNGYMKIDYLSPIGLRIHGSCKFAT